MRVRYTHEVSAMPVENSPLYDISYDSATSGTANLRSWSDISLTEYGRSVDLDEQVYFRAFSRVSKTANLDFERHKSFMSALEGTASSWISTCVGYFEDSQNHVLVWKLAESDSLLVYWRKQMDPGHTECVDRALTMMMELCLVVQALHEQSMVFVIMRPHFFRVEHGLTSRAGPVIRLADMASCESFDDSSTLRHPIPSLGDWRDELEGLPAVAGESSTGTRSWARPAWREEALITNHLHYIAPEITATTLPPNARSDQYSFGVCVYELFSERTLDSTGDTKPSDMLGDIYRHLTIDKPPLSDVNPHVPLPISEMVAKCLSRQPVDRYDSFDSLMHEIKHMMSLQSSGQGLDHHITGALDRMARRDWLSEMEAREAELPALHELYERVAQTGRTELAIIYGESGSGKTLLAEKWTSIRQMMSGTSPSLIGRAKMDENLVRPLSAFTQVFKSLLDSVMTDPREDISEWRRKILSTFPPLSEPFISMIPSEWQEVLLKGSPFEDQIGRHAQESIADPDAYLHQLRTWCRNLLQVFADARSSIMILIIDDVQWLSKEERSLWADLLDKPTRRVERMMVIGTFRTESSSDIPAFEPFVHLLHVGTFSASVVVQQLQKSFKWAAGDRRLVELGEILWKETGGNPFHLKALVQTMVQHRSLIFDFESREWQIHLGKMVSHTTAGVDSIIETNMSTLQPSTIRALGFLACLPSRDVPLNVLAKLLGQNDQATYDDLTPAASIGIAALAMLSRHDNAAEYHLWIGRTLNSIDTAELYVFDVVNNINAAKEMGRIIKSDEYVPLLLRAAQKANRAAAYSSVVSYLRHAEESLPLSDGTSWVAHRELCFRILGVWTDVGQGHKESAGDALALVRSARTHCRTVTEHLRLLLLDVRLSVTLTLIPSIPGLVYEAIELAGLSLSLDHAESRALSQLVPDSAEALSSLQAAFRASSPTPLTECDNIAILLNTITSIAGSVLFLTLPDYGESIYRICVGQAFRSPNVLRNAGSGYIMSIMGLLTSSRSQLDLACGYRDVAQFDVEYRGSPFASYIHTVVTSSAHIRTPVQEITYLSAWEAAMSDGNYEVAAYVETLDLMLDYVRGDDYGAGYGRALIRMKALDGEISPAAKATIGALVQTAENLMDMERPLAALSKMDGRHVTLGDGVVTEPYGFYPIMYYTSALVLAMVFEADHDMLLEVAAKSRQHSSGAPGTLVRLEYAFTYSLFMLSHPENDDRDYRGTLVAEMRAHKDSIDIRIRLAMIDCLEASTLYTPNSGPHWAEIVDRYDLAYAEAVSAKCWSIAGYLAYLTARFIIAVRSSTTLAVGYIIAAINNYETCKAYAVVRKVKIEFPEIARLLGESTSPNSVEKKPSIYDDDKADLDTRLSLESIVKSFLVLAAEKSREALLSKLLKILLQLSRAEYCAIALQGKTPGSDSLVLRAAGTFSSLTMCDVPLAQASAFCPVAPILHSAHTTSMLSDPAELQRWKGERFYRGVVPEWVLIVPLMIQGELAGVLYLDNRASRESPCADQSTEIISMLATFAAISHESISTTRSLEEAVERRTSQLQDALSAKSSFLSHMSHELRTPLFAVLGLAAVLEDSSGLDQNQRDYLSTIRSSGEDLQRIISGVLDYNKLESGSIEPENISFDLRTVVEGVVESMAMVAHSKRVHLFVATPVASDPTSQLKGDPHRIKQCLWNLVGNAVKFTPALGRVTLKWKLDDLGEKIRVAIEVIDTGPGVPPDKTDRLFKSFSQVDNTITRTHGGSGLGLAITQSLARLMGGDCTYHARLGRGSIFRLTIEVGISNEEVSPYPRAPAVKRHALLVSNDPARDVMVENLSHIGVECHVVHTTKGTLWEDALMMSLDFVVLDDILLSAAQLGDLRSKQSQSQFVLLTTERNGYSAKEDSKVLVKPVKAISLLQAFDSPLNLSAKSSENPGGKIMDRTFSNRFPLRILYVDDNKVNCMVGTKILQKFGYRNVEPRYNGLEAVNAIEKQAFDLVLLDLQMPVMDGFTALTEMQKRSRERGRPLPLVAALTAHSDVATQEKCASHGFWAFLAKPLDIGELKLLLEKAHAALRVQGSL